MAKKKVFKANYTILIDTREQAPWDFHGLTKRNQWMDHPLIIPTRDQRLLTGDYSIDGYTDKICVERKSLEDLIGTITRGRERFERELERMQSMDFAAIVVEADWGTVMRQCRALTDMNPASLDSSMLAFQMRYPRAHWFFRPTRYTAMKTAYKIFDVYLRRILQVKNAVCQKSISEVPRGTRPKS